MNGSEIRTGIKLTGDASGLTAAFAAGEHAAQDFDKQVKQVGNSSGKLTSELGGVQRAIGQVISVAAAWQLGKLAMSSADDMSILQSRLKLVTASANELAYVQKRVFDIAQVGRGVYSDLGALYAQTARSTADLNISQERLLNLTQSINQAMAISGGPIDSQRAAIVQLTQGLASGTLRGEELNSVMEQTPRLATAIAQGMGVSLGQLRALGADGKLTAVTIIEALEKSAPALKREFEQVTPTISQAFQTVKNSSTLFIGEFDKATGASKGLATGLTSVANAIGSVAQSVTSNERAWSTLGALVTGAASVGVLAAGWFAVAGGIARVGAVIAANPVLAMLLGGGAILNAAVENQSAFNATEGGARAKLEALQARVARLDELIARGGNQGDVARLTADRERVSKSLQTAQAAVSGYDNKTNSARDQFRASERNDVARSDAGAMFPGAKSLEEVRKYAKLAVDVQREAYDQSVDIAKSYQNRIKLATSDEAKVALTKEMNARLIQVDKDAAREIKAIGEQGAADAKQLTEAQFADKKARLELTASIERQAMDQQTRTNEQLYKLNLVDVETYYDRKTELALQDLAITERLTSAELQQAQAVAAAARKQDDKLQAQARVVGLERELVELATKKAAIEADPGNQRALRLKAEQDEFRAYSYREQLRSAQDGYGQAAQFDTDNTRLKIQAIKDPNRQKRAELEEELRLRKALVDSISDADARELATEKYNEFVINKNTELEERLKPGWQRMADGWGDTTTLMRDSFASSMDGVLKSGEDAFVQLSRTGKISISSLVDFGISELARLAFRASVGGIAKGGGGGGLGGLLSAAISAFTGGGMGTDIIPQGVAASAAEFGGGGMMDELANYGVFHTGGILGGTFPSSRRASMGLFRGAPRFHTGGIMGDEVPIIGKRGEGVFTPEQMANLAPVGAGGAGGPQVTLNVSIQGNARAEVTGQRRTADGGMQVDLLITQMTEALADGVAAGSGALAGAIESRYGLRTAVG